MVEGINQPTLYHIDFDILVNVTKNTISDSKGSLNISVISTSVGNEKNNNLTTQQRIQFSVPYVPQAIHHFDNKS